MMIRLLAAVALVAASVAGTATPGAAADPKTELAGKYAPVVMIRQQDRVCGNGEQYRPVSVDAVLGNPSVALRQVGNGDAVITWGPTAKDLYGLGEGVYLDFPGDSLRPGCVYATDSSRFVRRDGPAVYAHVVQQADRPGFVALQYWFYWYYNDWNDKHESDWEFVQLLFRADTVEQALTVPPESMGFAQHEGGQITPWSSDELRKDGDHPVVYASRGSHASYLEPALFLGRGASEGFGCDDTEEPSSAVRPRVIVLPDRPTGPDDPDAWLAFAGAWGERHAAPNGGPTGPAAKDRWTQPVSWQDGLRPSSFVIPGGSAAAPRVVGAFCAAVGAGSVVFTDYVSSPPKVIGTLAVLVLLLWLLLRRTSWKRVDPLPIVRRRRLGEIVRAAGSLYRRRPGAFLALGGMILPIAAAAALIGELLGHIPVIGSAVRVVEAGGRASEALGPTVLSVAFLPVALALGSAATAVLLDGPAGPVEALRAVGRRARALASSILPAAVLAGVLSLTVIGVPFALWLAVRCCYLPQVTMLEDREGRAALRRSGELVRGRWGRTAAIVLLAWPVVGGCGLAAGLALLVSVPSLPLWVESAAVVAVEAALVPLAAATITLLYGDARAAVEDGATEAAAPAPA